MEEVDSPCENADMDQHEREITMSNLFTRRSLVKTVGLTAAGLILNPLRANADQGSTVPFSEENAIKIAKNYQVGLGIPSQYTATAALPFYTSSGIFSGYIVMFNSNDDYGGYMTLDIHSDQLLADFSFSPNSTPPFMPSKCTNLSKDFAQLSKSDSKVIVRANHLIYGVADTVDGTIQFKDGTTELVPKSFASPRDTILDKYTVPSSYIWNSCSVTQMKTWNEGFFGLSEQDILLYAGKYACYVVAAYAIANHWYTFNAPYIDNNQYDAIWNLTGTTFLQGSYIAGGTNPTEGARGFAQYCKSYHGDNRSYQIIDEIPNSLPIVDSIDNDWGCILTVDALATDGVAHAAAVEGYLRTIEPAGNQGWYMCVYDGWYASGRYLSLSPHDGSDFNLGAHIFK